MGGENKVGCGGGVCLCLCLLMLLLVELRQHLIPSVPHPPLHFIICSPRNLLTLTTGLSAPAKSKTQEFSQLYSGQLNGQRF